MAFQKYKVIFDTNFLYDDKRLIDTFFGKRSELKRFLEYSEIIIPDMVIDEIKSKKRKQLESKRDAFLSNPFHSLRKVGKTGTQNFDIEGWVEQLMNAETIPFSSISLTKTHQEDMRSLSLQNSPPFHSDTDRGFKDTYIYFTVLEFLENNKDIEKVFFVTNDARLQLAFQDIPRVENIKTYDDFEFCIGSYFREEYFVNRLKEETKEDITVDCIDDYWINVNENWVIKLKCDEITYYVEVAFSSKEILNLTNFDFSVGIRNLINSGLYQSTHLHIREISGHIQYFSDPEIRDLILAATVNTQIYEICFDSDVRIFFLSIFDAKSEIIPQDVRERFKEKFQYDPDI